MVNDFDAIIDDLLIRWHYYSSKYQLAKAYASTDATCRMARSNWSSYDRDNGIAEEESAKTTMQSVERAVERMRSPWPLHHHMICVEARNLATGFEVWSSPRLPQNRDEREVLRIEARNKLAKELMEEGCVGN